VIARVVPDITGLDRLFDYRIPDHLADRVRVGTVVRVPLHGRRVRGWVVAVTDAPETDRPLLALSKVTGWGPPPDVVELARWAAWRWAGHPTHFLATASPPTAVLGLPPPPAGRGSATRAAGEDPPVVSDAFARARAVVRVPPAGDPVAFALAAAARGDALVLAPTLADAAAVAERLRRSGYPVAVAPREWARAAAGGCTVVGARAAAWAPVPRLAAAVVLDEHDEGHQGERTPTWNAREVVVQRARRAGAPCVLTSPCPSLESLNGAELVVPARREERDGWPIVEVVDRRREPPGLGLYSERLVDVVRGATGAERVVCVLNRKGRVRLLACATCRELARCEVCEGAMQGADEGLRCQRCGAAQPGICRVCGSGRLKALRVGVSRAREELEVLARQPVAELTADADVRPAPEVAIVVGTEAVLYRIGRARTVAFLDFDQELLAARYRAGEEALALVARAARMVGGRTGGGRVLVQTRLPEHEALDAAVHADPGRLALVESARRAALRLPPETALARVSGPGAEELVDQLAHTPGVELLGPSGDRWLVRAAHHTRLCDAFAGLRRPAARVRVEVDPLRA
jgi:primosomal protein N' (replication factor Y)